MAPTAAVGISVLFTGAGTYQASAMGFDPHPLRVGARVLRLAGLHLRSLVWFRPSEVLYPIVGAAALAFVVAWILVRRASGATEASRAARVRLGLTGLAAAVLGWLVFALSAGIRTGDRTQFLSAPGVGLLLAVVACSVAAAFPPARRGLVAGACGAWIVAVGAGRTAALQRDWDDRSLWPVQNRSLVQLTDLLPHAADNTLIVLLDYQGAWPANFTFRHAVQHLYGDAARGWVPDAHGAYLYPAFFTDRGLRYEPWPAIRDAWRAPVTEHRFDEMVVVRLSADGRLRLEEAWPEGILPALPASARYAPRERILPSGAPMRSREILRRE
jgi:hypothetical protein